MKRPLLSSGAGLVSEEPCSSLFQPSVSRHLHPKRPRMTMMPASATAHSSLPTTVSDNDSDSDAHQVPLNKRRRRVKLSLAPTVHTIDASHNSSRKSDLFWSKTDRIDRLLSFQETYETYRQNKRKQVSGLLTIWNDCQEVTALDQLETMAIQIPASVRGLEYGLLPETKTCRRSHVETVLGMQEHTNWRSNLYTKQEAQEQVATAARASSRPSLLWSRLVALGDVYSAIPQAVAADNNVTANASSSAQKKSKSKPKTTAKANMSR